jgi:hypothetical protein
MIAVIFGLVAVVLLVLVVVALGMRSMNRRESNLPPERLRKMAEQADNPNAKRPGRPAEDTFFESFPEGFDAFQEPERATARLRPGNGRPASRPAGRPGGRPAPRGKQAASSRGRRGVDEWGDADDYDDDYWTRVRADDGAFGGTIAARVGASRPDVASPSAPRSVSPKPAQPKEETDANAATVQAPLPNRSAGLAGLVESTSGTTPSSAASAAERTVTFPAPVPQAQAPAAAASAADVLGALGTPQPSSRARRGSRPDPADPLGVGDAVRAKPRRRSDSGGEPGRATPARGMDSRGADSRRTDSRRRGEGTARPEAGRAVPGRSDAVRADSGSTVTGPFAAGRPATGPLPAGLSSADPLSGGPLTTGPLAGGPFTTGSIANDPLSSGALSNGSVSRGPSAGGPLSTGPASGGFRSPGSAEAPHTRGSFDAGRSSTGSFDAGRSSTGSYETPRATGGSPGSGSFPASGAYDPLGAPPGGSWPAQPAYPATGSYDILDEPASPSGSSNETWKAADYQLPAYEGYGAREGYTPETSYTPPQAAPSAPSAPSYEVRPGWATIDDSDGASAATPPGGLPAGPPRGTSGYETPAGRGVPSPQGGDDTMPGSGAGFGGGYEPDRYPAAGSPSGSWPQQRQNSGGSWPSYGELYGSAANGVAGADQPTQSSQASPSRGGHRRPADSDYPDYYR